MAFPTAREARGLPIVSAIEAYVVTLPAGILSKASQTLSWNGDACRCSFIDERSFQSPWKNSITGCRCTLGLEAMFACGHFSFSCSTAKSFESIKSTLQIPFGVAAIIPGQKELM